jgi:hypothetical protein
MKKTFQYNPSPTISKLYETTNTKSQKERAERQEDHRANPLLTQGATRRKKGVML